MVGAGIGHERTPILFDLGDPTKLLCPALDGALCRVELVSWPIDRTKDIVEGWLDGWLPCPPPDQTSVRSCRTDECARVQPKVVVDGVDLW